MVDHDSQILVAAPHDLIDPDPGQPREPVGLGLRVSHDPGHDRPDGPPGDPQQVPDRGLAAVRHSPSGRVIEGVGVAGAVPSPRDLRRDDPMIGALDPG